MFIHFPEMLNKKQIGNIFRTKRFEKYEKLFNSNDNKNILYSMMTGNI